jgi:hypothetical protein
MTSTIHPPAERIYDEVLRGEQVFRRLAELGDGTTLTAREGEFRDLGFCFGLAYGWAESSDPEQRADEALDAARAAFERWAGSVSPRPAMAPLAEAVLLAGERASKDLDRLIGNPSMLALKEALDELTDAVGAPALVTPRTEGRE